MPWLIYRYLLVDLLRVFMLTATVLVLVIAFGATLKPLTGDTLLSAIDTVKYLFLATVPMLQFAIPFAAGFASTMVLHRMTGDNEIFAAAASGISYRKLLLPIIALGLALTLIMVMLTQWAIPRFWSIMERTVTADVTKLFQASIDRGTPFRMGNVQIYADDLRVIANPSDTQADTRLRLGHVAAAELDRDGRIDTEVTARTTIVDIYRRDGQTYLQLVMLDTVAFDGKTGQLARSERLEPNRPIIVPSALRDQLRAMTRWELLELRQDPDRYYRVQDDRSELAEAMRDRDIWATIDEQLRDRGRVELVQTGPGDRRYVIFADRLRNGVFLRTGDEAVEVRQFRGQSIHRRMAAEQVQFHRIPGTVLGEPTFELEMLNAEVQDLAHDGAVNQRERIADRNLRLAGLEVKEVEILPSRTLLERADPFRADNRTIEQAASRLQGRISDLEKEISARLLMRYAQSTTAMLLLVIGATLAMWLRNTLPLVIYLWAFMPSILALITISGGDKMMRDGHIFVGFSVMWSANAALFLLFAFAFWRLIRN